MIEICNLKRTLLISYPILWSKPMDWLSCVSLYVLDSQSFDKLYQGLWICFFLPKEECWCIFSLSFASNSHWRNTVNYKLYVEEIDEAI
jgi:hypothetical protein